MLKLYADDQALVVANMARGWCLGRVISESGCRTSHMFSHTMDHVPSGYIS